LIKKNLPLPTTSPSYTYLELALHIRDLRRLRQMLDYKITCTICLATSIVSSKLDHCNSLFYGINSSQIKRLKTIQSALARAVTKTPKHDQTTPVLKSLHWLKVLQRIHYKNLLLAILFFLHSPISHHPTARVYSLIIISFPNSFSRPSLKFCNSYLPTLHQLFGTDCQKTCGSLLSFLTHLLISPILRLYSPLLHSTHD